MLLKGKGQHQTEHGFFHRRQGSEKGQVAGFCHSSPQQKENAYITVWVLSSEHLMYISSTLHRQH